MLSDCKLVEYFFYVSLLPTKVGIIFHIYIFFIGMHLFFVAMTATKNLRFLLILMYISL